MKSTKLTSKMLAFMAVAGMVSSACGNKNASFGLLSDSTNFQQNSTPTINKIDILWVVDNSFSMDPLQQETIQNFGTFIQNFNNQGVDFQMAVTTSDAYLGESAFNNDPTLFKFRDGVGSSHTGVFMVNPQTPDLVNTFVTNASQGQNGSGDERAFQSMLDSLGSNLNTGFFRQGAFHAVIILSDEDDFSNATRGQGAGPDHDYTQAGLFTIDSVISQLDQLTSSTATNRHYSVSAITVLDSTCQQSHSQQAPSSIIGQRYIQLANATNGVLGSVCDSSYANTLNAIQQKIVELATQFYLDRTPQPDTLAVTVNGVSIAHLQPTDPQPWNGFIYHSDTNSITFHGTAVPPSGAVISVKFDPTGLK